MNENRKNVGTARGLNNWIVWMKKKATLTRRGVGSVGKGTAGCCVVENGTAAVLARKRARGELVTTGGVVVVAICF